jgi:urea transport system permease protein
MAPVWNVDPQMGLSVLVPAFLAILIGGAGGIGGPVMGAMVIGGTETAVASAYAPVVAQIVVLTLAILLIRAFPRGILGGRR